MKRSTYLVEASAHLNPDDLDGASAADLADGLRARLGEFYVEGVEVRTLDPIHVTVTEAEIDMEPKPDDWTVLLKRLAVLRDFHAADGPAAGFDVSAMFDDVTTLLRTHALPEDHPEAIR